MTRAHASGSKSWSKGLGRWRGRKDRCRTDRRQHKVGDKGEDIGNEKEGFHRKKQRYKE